MRIQGRNNEANGTFPDIQMKLVDPINQGGEDRGACTGSCIFRETSVWEDCDIVAISSYIGISVEVSRDFRESGGDFPYACSSRLQRSSYLLKLELPFDSQYRYRGPWCFR